MPIPAEDESRSFQLKLAEYIGHLMHYHDRRFVRHRESGLYWKNVRQDLMAMIVSDTGLNDKWSTFYLTLSAADTSWPDLFRAIDPSLRRRCEEYVIIGSEQIA